MVAPNINVAPPPGPPPGGPPSAQTATPPDDPVRVIKDKFLLETEVYNLLMWAFMSINAVLEEYEELDPLGLTDRPKHYRARVNTGEIVLLRVTQNIIEDPAIQPYCLHMAVTPFLADAAGLYVFAETQTLPDAYEKLVEYWSKLGHNMRRASFILTPQVQQLKAMSGPALMQEVKKLLRLEQVAGLLDVMSDADKRAVAQVIADMASASGNTDSFMEQLVNGLELRNSSSSAHYSAISSYAGEKNPFFAAQKLVEFCQNSTYPKNDASKVGFTMLGQLLLTILDSRGDQALAEFVAKYRLVTDAAAVAKLKANYPNVVF